MRPKQPWSTARSVCLTCVFKYETADGERVHIDLELATENYRAAHMSQKLRAGFKIYGVNSTSRDHRAEWEGRELTAQELAL